MRMYRCVCVLAILGVSASMMQFPSPGKFQFLRSQYRRTDSCNICFGSDCLPFDQDRCDYYAEANDMLLKEEEDPMGFQEPQLREDVDSIMFDIVEKANQASDIECIPYVSRYTDCDKETVCIGCKTCQCDSEGRWQCTILSECRVPEPAIDINHQVLVTVVENIINSVKSSRRKRSNSDSQPNISKSTILTQEINDWLYGMNPSEKEPPILMKTTAPNYVTLGNDSPLDNTTKNTVESFTEHNLESSPTDSTTDSDYLAFNDVLNNIATDTKNYTRRKPPPQPIDDETIDFDYMLGETGGILELDSNIKNNVTKFFIDTPTENDVTESNSDNTTKVVIDLLESVKNNNLFNETDYMDMIDYKNDLIDYIDKANNIVNNNVLNIMKREVSAISNTSEAPNITYTTTLKSLNMTSDNATDNILNETYLKKSVLLPLVKIIINKDKETEELNKIKQNLITFMKSNNQSPVVEILDYPNISETNALHDMEMFPDLAYEMRRSDVDMLENFLHKLKADVFEVTKDIINLKRYEQSAIPEDLATLVDALQRYLHKVEPLQKPDKTDTLNNFAILTRRHGEQNLNKCSETTTFKECIVEVLQTIDKDLLIDNVIPVLSPFSRRIIRNILRTYYVDDISAVGMKVHDPTYNITNDLKSLGSKWQDMTHKIIVRSPFVTLYRMKLVHLFLKIDVNKITDALTIVEFALNRRMIPYFNNVPNNIIDHINKEVKAMYNKMQIIAQYYSKYPKKIKDILTSGSQFEEAETFTTVATNLLKEQHYKKKISFFKRIRNLLKTPKVGVDDNDQKLSKSEIVRKLALKKLNHMAQKRYLEYEEAMKKWQKTLGVLPQPRSKRDLIESLRGRIKNIIPKYLRHKVNPKLNKKKKTNQRDNKNKIKKELGHKKHRKTTLTTATTPKTKPTTTAHHIKSTRKSHKTLGANINKTASYLIHFKKSNKN